MNFNFILAILVFHFHLSFQLTENINMSEVISMVAKKKNLFQKLDEKIIGVRGDEVPQVEPKLHFKTFGFSHLNYATVIQIEKTEGVYFTCVYNLNSEKQHTNKILFKTYDFGVSWNQAQFTLNSSDVEIDEIKHSETCIVAYKRNENYLFISNDLGKTFKSHELNFKIKKVFLNSFDAEQICIVSGDDSLYFGFNFEILEVYPVTKMKILDIIWTESTEFFYAIWENENKIRTVFEVYTNFLKYPRHIFNSVQRIVVIRGIHFAICGDQWEDLFVKRGGGFVKTKFPENLLKSKIKVVDVIDDEIFVALTNKDKTSLLLSASINDLRFIRLKNDIKYIEQQDGEFCYQVFLSNEIPGFVMANHEKISKTYVSFSNGVFWDQANSQLFSQDKDCNDNKCKFFIELTCNDNRLIKKRLQVTEKSPHLMVAEGMLIKNFGFPRSDLYISQDFGRSWRLSRNGDHVSVILDHGGVILAITKFSHEIYYSFDEGDTWITHGLPSKQFSSYIEMHSKSGNQNFGFFFGVDFSKNEFMFLGIDVSNILGKDCERSSYYLATPGAKDREHCFRGKKNSYWKRVQNARCQNIITRLPKPDDQICPCINEDFGCSFGYFMSNGKCIQDYDAKVTTKDECQPGQYHYVEHSRQKIDKDQCIRHDKSIPELEICKLTQNDEFLVARADQKYFFLPLSENMDKSESYEFFPLDFPFEQSKILGFDIDIPGECIYFVSEIGITHYCWKLREKFIEHKTSIFFKSTDFKKIQIDSPNRIMFIGASTSISILTLDTKIYREILYLLCNVENFLWVQKKHVIFVICSNSFFTSSDAFSIRSYSMNGQLKNSREINKKPVSMYFNEETDELIIVHKSSFTILDFVLSTDRNENSEYAPLIGLDNYKSNKFIYTNSIVYINKKPLTVKNLDEVRLYRTTNNKGICQRSNCEFICLQSGTNEFQCVCPEKMKFDENHKCVCLSYYPNCQKCQAHQFQCKSNDCVDSSLVCNGVNDCIDGSDEENCKYDCAIDEFKCLISLECISKYLVCNGVQDCKDGSDESNCISHVKCKPDEFTCHNLKCLPSSKVCDGHDDCGDNSDESDCHKYEDCTETWQFKCNNGECILKAQVCDSFFDCSDWSDEKNCGNVEFEYYNDTCRLFCDNNCIPKEKICDHIMDCSDGSDELSCGFVPQCREDYILCQSEEYCKSKSEMCVPYEPCLEPSRPVDCKIDYCSEPLNFKCLDKKKCLNVNKVCDGILDCEDGSDETNLCSALSRVESIKIEYSDLKNIKIIATSTINKLNSKMGMIIVNRKESLPSAMDTQYFISTTTMAIWDYCTTYTIFIWDETSPGFVRSIDFTPRIQDSYTLFIEKPVISQGSVSWNSIIPPCYPINFYLLCEVGDHEFLNFFTTETKLKLPNMTVDNCKVSACPYPIFNYSCSPFHDISEVKPLTIVSNKSRIIVAIMVTIILVVCAAILYRNRDRTFKAIKRSLMKIHTVTGKDIAYSQGLETEQQLLNESSEWLEDYM